MTRAKSRLIGNVMTEAITTICAGGTSLLDVALSRHCAPSNSNSQNQDPLLTYNAADPYSSEDTVEAFVTCPAPVEDGEISDTDEMMDLEDDGDTVNQRYSKM
jgi:hypothetical protein